MDSTKDKHVATVRDRLAALAASRREILSRPPQEALEAIVDAPQPAALVHSFPEQDLYLLVQDIGPQDALPLLALASDRQREFIFDIESWQKDRLSLPVITRWLQLFFAADSPRLISWVADQKTVLLESLLFRCIEVRIREHDQDPSEFGSEFFTYDDVFYVRVGGEFFAPGKEEGEGAAPPGQAAQEFVSDLLQRLALRDHPRYQAILLETIRLMPAEIEEEEYRLRNVRLAEKGFLPFDEAIGVYQPLDPARLVERSAKRLVKESDSSKDFQVPGHTDLIDRQTLFAGALDRIEPGEVLDQLQSEFAALCNQVVVADQRLVRDKKTLGEVVGKVCGYLSIGLSATTGLRPDPVGTALLIRRYPLADIFRVGFGQSLSLKWRAEAWMKRAWFRKAGLPLVFWGESWTGVLGGLLIKKPLCFDPHGKETLYREFATLDEIERAGRVLDEIAAVDALFERIDPVVATKGSQGMATYENLLLTLWARDYLNRTRVVDQSPAAEPITLDRFRHFFEALLPDASPGDLPRRVPQRMKAAFLAWLESVAGLVYDEVGEQLGATLSGLFDAIEDELGRVAGEDLDPRYISLFLISA